MIKVVIPLAPFIPREISSGDFKYSALFFLPEYAKDMIEFSIF
jgi:hypothetical protein